MGFSLPRAASEKGHCVVGTRISPSQVVTAKGYVYVFASASNVAGALSQPIALGTTARDEDFVIILSTVNTRIY